MPDLADLTDRADTPLMAHLAALAELADFGQSSSIRHAEAPSCYDLLSQYQFGLLPKVSLDSFRLGIPVEAYLLPNVDLR